MYHTQFSIAKNTHIHTPELSQSFYFNLSAVSLFQCTVHHHSIQHNFRVTESPKIFSSTYVCVCVCARACVCVHTPPTFPIWIRTSSSQHVLYKHKRGHFFSFPHLNKRREWSSILPPPHFYVVFARVKLRNNIFTIEERVKKEMSDKTNLLYFAAFCTSSYRIKMIHTRSWFWK